MRDDYEPFFEFVRASGLRLNECVTLKWTEVNFGTRQIVRIGKGGRRVVFPITDAIRDILFPLQGQHPEFVFTYVAIYGNRKLGRVRGQRYPLTYNGTKAAWQRCAPRPASPISASTTTGMTSAPSCCATAATSSWFRRR
jgi:integrase